ncbi:hypothetical protein ABMA77_01125 [Halobacteriovorax sp. RZ-1]|uniref:hypothetical protein n=1 Tax=unclassified Halobacteriovorax TaxID=2639665 RepID=UPI00371B13DF
MFAALAPQSLAKKLFQQADVYVGFVVSGAMGKFSIVANNRKPRLRLASLNHIHLSFKTARWALLPQDVSLEQWESHRKEEAIL